MRFPTRQRTWERRSALSPGGMYKLKPGQYRITTLEVGQEYEYLNGLMSFTIEKIEGCIVYAKVTGPSRFFTLRRSYLAYFQSRIAGFCGGGRPGFDEKQPTMCNPARP